MATNWLQNLQSAWSGLDPFGNKALSTAQSNLAANQAAAGPGTTTSDVSTIYQPSVTVSPSQIQTGIAPELTGGAPTGSTGGGAAPAGGGQFVFEDEGTAESGKQEQFDVIDQAIQAGMGALDQFQSTLQPAFETTSAGIKAEAEDQVGQARSDEARRLGEYGRQRETETGRTESAIASSRRMANEILTGLGARFGGSTGTGRFGGELVGRQVLENINNNRIALQDTIGRIASAEDDVKRETARFVDNANKQAQLMIERARNELNQQLAQIAGQRAELAGAKAEMRLQAIQNYQNLLAGIRQRNADLQNQIALKSQQAMQQLGDFANRAQLTFQAQIDPFTNEVTYKTGDIPLTQEGVGYISQVLGTPGLNPAGTGTALNEQGQQALNIL